MPAEFWADYTHRVSVVGGFTASGNGPWWAICSVAKAELQTATGWGLDWTTKDGGEVLEASEVIGVPTSCPRLAHSSPRPRAPPWLRDSIWSSFVQPDPSLSTPAKCICSPDTKQKKKKHRPPCRAHPSSPWRGRRCSPPAPYSSCTSSRSGRRRFAPLAHVVRQRTKGLTLYRRCTRESSATWSSSASSASGSSTSTCRGPSRQSTSSTRRCVTRRLKWMPRTRRRDDATHA